MSNTLSNQIISIVNTWFGNNVTEEIYGRRFFGEHLFALTEYEDDALMTKCFAEINDLGFNLNVDEETAVMEMIAEKAQTILDKEFPGYAYNDVD